MFASWSDNVNLEYLILCNHVDSEVVDFIDFAFKIFSTRIGGGPSVSQNDDNNIQAAKIAAAVTIRKTRHIKTTVCSKELNLEFCHSREKIGVSASNIDSWHVWKWWWQILS